MGGACGRDTWTWIGSLGLYAAHAAKRPGHGAEAKMHGVSSGVVGRHTV